MNHPKPIIGELYLITDEDSIKDCLVLPEVSPVTLGQVYQCVQHWEQHDVYEYHRVVMREDRFYLRPHIALARNAGERCLGEPLGHLPCEDDSPVPTAGERHKVIQRYASLMSSLFTTKTQAFLRTIDPGEILRLESDDNGTPFPAGGVFVYDNHNGKLTLGQHHDGCLVKERVVASELRNVTLASIIGAPARDSSPRRVQPGDFVGLQPFFEVSRYHKGPSLTMAPFAFVERASRAQGMRTRYHLAMQNSYGAVHRGITEDIAAIHWLC